MAPNYNCEQLFLKKYSCNSCSSITMPVAMECLEKRNKVEERIVRFTLPIGTTLNMDGTALYEAVAVIFLAQGRDVNLDFGNLVLVW